MYSDTHPELELTNEELYRAWFNIYKWNKKYGLQWNPLIEMVKNLKGEKGRTCTYNKCDLYNTHTISILPDGQIGNCDRTFGGGLYTRSLSQGSCGRYEALSQLDCAGCRYWDVCGGGCPMEGIGGDWRRKTRFCEAIYKTYALVEREEKIHYTPEKTAQARYGEGSHGDSTHGDMGHGDMGHGDVPHGDSTHGDMPHGDSTHGDSPDYRR